MKYLCLVYHEEAKMDALPASQLQALVDEALAYREELQTSGRYIASSALHPTDATTIRVHHGVMSIVEGPVLATAAQLGGFYLIEATDLNDAIRVAARMPPVRLGCVEVRPLTGTEGDSQFGAGLDRSIMADRAHRGAVSPGTGEEPV